MNMDPPLPEKLFLTQRAVTARFNSSFNNRAVKKIKINSKKQGESPNQSPAQSPSQSSTFTLPSSPVTPKPRIADPEPSIIDENITTTATDNEEENDGDISSCSEKDYPESHVLDAIHWASSQYFRLSPDADKYSRFMDPSALMYIGMLLQEEAKILVEKHLTLL